MPRCRLNVCLSGVFVFTAALLIVDWQTEVFSTVRSIPRTALLQLSGASNALESLTVREFIDDAEVHAEMVETKTDMKVDGTILTINKEPSPYVKRPMKIHILLHSHVDPGWLKTFEEYYEDQVNLILDKAVDWLTKTPHLRFIWSEMSFLERWWSNATDDQQKQMKDLVLSGRLELCGGAWVMTDEATPHFSATIDNIVEGHRFVWDTFGVRPNTSWSVDPFGHGLMVPALLPVSGVDKMVIGRLNDNQKQQMRDARMLRFRWMQPYQKNGSSNSIRAPFVNTLPYLYYTTRSACGPRDDVCCKYHVGSSANWCSGTIHEVTDIEKIAEDLMTQYREVQHLYNTEDVLIAVGDDFYLTHEDDWSETINLYTAIAKHINKIGSYGATMRFSTVSEFFNSIKKQEKTAPTLTGDFFPYTQGERQSYTWWSGYFTHRPYYKRVGRLLETRLRSFDLLTVMHRISRLTNYTSKARRDIALFQHHDAITGTSKIHVMEDYLKRLLEAHKVLGEETSDVVALTTNRPGGAVNALEDTPSHSPCLVRSSSKCTHTKMPENAVIMVPHGRKVTVLIFNPLVNVKEHVVRLRVNRKDITVLSSTNEPIDAQINPVYRRYEKSQNKEEYELVFLATVQGFETAEFVLDGHEGKSTAEAAVNEYAATNFAATLTNGEVDIGIVNGVISNLSLNGKAFNTSIEMFHMSDHGGSYVMELRDGKTDFGSPDETVIMSGPIEHKIVSFFKTYKLKMETSLVHSPAPHIQSAIDIRIQPETPTATGLYFSVASSLFNDGQFSTDANGMYMMRRTINEEKPAAANYFPASSSAFIEDKLHRISVHLGQPNGVTADKHGRLTLNIDRVVSTDDGKGLPYGEDLDQHAPDIRLRIVPETRAPTAGTTSPAHSQRSQRALDNIRHRPVVFVVRQPTDGDYVDVHPPSPPVDENEDDAEPGGKESANSVSSAFAAWPCQLDLVSIRFVTESEVLVIVRRILFDRTIEETLGGCSTDLENAWRALKELGSEINHCNLAGTEVMEAASLTTLRDSLSTPYSLVPLIIQVKS